MKNGRYRDIAICPICNSKMGKFSKEVDNKKYAQWLENKKKQRKTSKVVVVKTPPKNDEGKKSFFQPRTVEHNISEPHPPSPSFIHGFSGALISFVVAISIYVTHDIWGLLGLFFVVFTIPKFNEIAEGIRAWIFKKSETAKLEAEYILLEGEKEKIKTERGILETERKQINEDRNKRVAEFGDIKRAVGIDDIRRKQEEEIIRRNKFEATLLDKYSGILKLFTEKINKITQVETETLELRHKLDEVIDEAMKKMNKQPPSFENTHNTHREEKKEVQVKIVEKIKEVVKPIFNLAIEDEMPIDAISKMLPEADDRIRTTMEFLLTQNRAVKFSSILMGVPLYETRCGYEGLSQTYSMKELQRFIDYCKKYNWVIKLSDTFTVSVQEMKIGTEPAVEAWVEQYEEEPAAEDTQENPTSRNSTPPDLMKVSV